MLNFVVTELVCFIVAVSFGYAAYAAHRINETNKEIRKTKLRMEHALRKAQKELYVLSGGRI